MTTGRPVVLLIEDEPQMRRFLRASLGASGYQVVEASTAAEGVQLAASHHPAAILLDLGLPDEDGIEVTRRLREWTQTPIVVVSARGKEEDKVQALDAGADDYLSKPFGVNELLARLRAALRRTAALNSGAQQAALEVGGLRIDLSTREVWLDGTEVHLTPIEYKLLALLAQHAGRVLTHGQIMEHVWGRRVPGQSHLVRVHLAGLRKKIESNPAQPKLLTTELGVGYRLRVPR